MSDIIIILLTFDSYISISNIVYFRLGIENDIGPVLINLINYCESLIQIHLNGTVISTHLCRQIVLAIEDKQERNRGVQEARDQDAKEKGGGSVRAATTTGGATRGATRGAGAAKTVGVFSIPDFGRLLFYYL